MYAVATFSYIYECGYNERELKDYSANLGMEKTTNCRKSKLLASLKLCSHVVRPSYNYSQLTSESFGFCKDTRTP